MLRNWASRLVSWRIRYLLPRRRPRYALGSSPLSVATAAAGRSGSSSTPSRRSSGQVPHLGGERVGVHGPLRGTEGRLHARDLLARRAQARLGLEQRAVGAHLDRAGPLDARRRPPPRSSRPTAARAAACTPSGRGSRTWPAGRRPARGRARRPGARPDARSRQLAPGAARGTRSAASIAPWVCRQQGQALIQFSLDGRLGRLAARRSAPPVASLEAWAAALERHPRARPAPAAPRARRRPRPSPPAATCRPSRTPPAARRRRSSASATALGSRGRVRAGAAAATAAPTPPHTAVGCQPSS